MVPTLHVTVLNVQFLCFFRKLFIFILDEAVTLPVADPEDTQGGGAIFKN